MLLINFKTPLNFKSNVPWRAGVFVDKHNSSALDNVEQIVCGFELTFFILKFYISHFPMRLTHKTVYNNVT